MSSTSDSNSKAVADSAARIARGAGAIASSAQDLTGSAERTIQLAADRTVLAAERTYAAWIRTGLAALASGIGAKALLQNIVPNWLVDLTGSLLILFSAFCFVAALWREFRPGVPPPRPDTRRLPMSLLIGINGFLMLVSFAALIGIWSGIVPK
jgi:putative membrane protein